MMMLKTTSTPRHLLFGGLLFLVAFWYWGYDGIAFTDDVTYLQLGHQWWQGEKVLTDDHFTSRWGAYLLPGLLTTWLGFDDHLASLSSLIFYGLSLLIIWKVIPSPGEKKWALLFFITPIYLLHFLPKVFPDSALVLWVLLIPAIALYRFRFPFWAALLMAITFLVGFCTKETMVLLGPFPILLLWMDWKQHQKLRFHLSFFACSLLIWAGYFGYYYWYFGDPFFRFQSVNAGHYISEYTYYDKGWLSILKRITFLPIFTFVERTYWIWIVLAIPAMVHAIKNKLPIHRIFALCTICLITGFWLMTSTLEFYNPIYLNPRHLTILIGPLSVLVALGSPLWLNDGYWKKLCAVLIAIGGVLAIFSDWKIACFYLVFAGVLHFFPFRFKWPGFAMLLIAPVVFSAYQQKKLKNYPHLQQQFKTAVEECAAENATLLTHAFMTTSQEVILQASNTPTPVVSMENIDALQSPLQDKVTLFIYKYYRHAYPEEGDFIQQAKQYLEKNNYSKTDVYEDNWLMIHTFEKNINQK